ncbi:Golgi phosphoprotein 3 (GPP34) [Geodermatophilus obscurus]|uniref:Golgi phosphoprotein 3 (GPP34) n=1 Tax=Geodermatophilus obscurus TaxID=1861 RepID=A0A1I5IJ29_9ACTN|nr:GPP34 family phosphoprotein [Geodermatophilus obscurus]SFO60379.1 Golgi phosphoprotein 3 (GPP34) [Geodermatophilus obscurus]
MSHPVSTLLAEDLLLLTAHPIRATVHRPTGLALPRALAGAVVHDLLTLGAARLHGGLLLLTAGSATAPRPLHDLSTRLATEQPVDRTIDALAAPRARLGQHLLQSLADGGAVIRRDRRLFGVVPVPSYEVTAPDTVPTLRARVATALRGPLDDARATVLARLVCAGDLYSRVGVDAATTGAVAATAGGVAAAGN